MTDSDTKRHQSLTINSSAEELVAVANDIRAPIHQIEEKSELLLQELDPADRALAVHAIRSAVGTLRLVLNYLDEQPAKQFAAAITNATTADASAGTLSTHAVLRLLAARLAFAADQHDVHFELEADVDLPALSESDAELTKRALMRVIEYLIRVVGVGGSIHLHCRRPDDNQALALDITLNPQSDVAALCMGISSILDLRALIDDEGCFDDAAACLGGEWRVQHGTDSTLSLHLDNHKPKAVIESTTVEVPAAQILTMEESLVQVESIPHRFDLGREHEAPRPIENSNFSNEIVEASNSADETLTAVDQATLAPIADGILGTSIEQSTELPRVLIIDGNTISQRLLTRMLDTSQFHTLIEGDARALLSRLASESFSAILIDCRIAGVDCYKLASEVRSLEANLGRKPARIIGMSANLDKDSAERCREAGMNGFLSKPISRTALAQAILGDLR